MEEGIDNPDNQDSIISKKSSKQKEYYSTFKLLQIVTHAFTYVSHSQNNGPGSDDEAGLQSLIRCSPPPIINQINRCFLGQSKRHKIQNLNMLLKTTYFDNLGSDKKYFKV